MNIDTKKLREQLSLTGCLSRRNANHALDHIDAQAAEIEALRSALQGVMRVADRATAEFDAARAALAQHQGEKHVDQ